MLHGTEPAAHRPDDTFPVMTTTPAARRDAPAWELVPVPQSLDPAAARAFCRSLAAAHYENFTVATWLVPRRLRQHLANVYAFARWADDLADEAASPAAATGALAAWAEELDACFAGRPRHPVTVALAETVAETRLPLEPFADLIDAFRQDQVKARYANRAEVGDYCRRSADPVGRIVLGLEGCRDPDLVRMSDAICTGLQLVNFWQDITRDRLAGRVYLPADDMARHGVSEAMLAETPAAPAVRSLLRDEVAWARSCFAAGERLPAVAPRSLRPAIGMFLGGGLAVADAIAAADYDPLSQRPTVGKVAKLGLAGRAFAAAAAGRAADWLGGRR
jgi:squalene synthase HpnC